MDGAASTHLRRPCTGFMTMFRACGGHRITAQASGLDFMSIQRMTLAFHTISLDLRRFALPLRLAASLAVIAIPLSGCSSATETWDKVYSMEKRNYPAAINRCKTVVTQYQTTRHVEDALARLTEAYMAIGIVTEAQTAAAGLGHIFPDTRWYQDAYNLVRSGGLEPSENRGSYISRAFEKLGLARN